MVDKKQQYSFECINNSDYLCVLKLHANSKWFKRGLSMMTRAIEKKTGTKVNLNGNADLEKISIDPRFFVMIAAGLSSPVDKIKQEVGVDGIKLLSHKITEAQLYKEGRNVYIDITLKGLYSESSQ